MASIKIRRKTGSSSYETVYPTADWSNIENKPTTFTPTSHQHSGTDITSGLIAPARLANGTPSSTTFLRGDGIWTTIATGGSKGFQLVSTLGSNTTLNTLVSTLQGLGLDYEQMYGYFWVASTTLDITWTNQTSFGPVFTYHVLTPGDEGDSDSPVTIEAGDMLVFTKYSDAAGDGDDEQFTFSVINNQDPRFANYLPLTGGTLTGTLGVNGGGGSNRATINLVSLSNVPNDLYFGSNSTQHWSFSSRESGNPFLGLYNTGVSNWAFTVGHGTNKMDFTNVPSVAGNNVIHAGTIGSQSVNFANSAGSATTATTSTQSYLGGTSAKLIADGVWAGAGGYPGYQFSGGNSRFGFSSTSGYVDVYTDGNFYAGIDLNGSNNLVLHSGNFADYAVRTSGQSNWSSVGTIGNVVGLLAWKNYGNSHVVFDASNSTSPSGGSVNSTNSQIPWSASYPTLMGWNGSATYGVRVDRARQADYLVGTWDTSSRNYNREWIEMPNHTGLYSPINGAHFYPNDGSYGAWKIIGSRNGWRGLEFVTSSNGNVSLMVASNATEVGFHNNNIGWQMYWSSGSGYIGKSSTGGGTLARIHDSSNLAFSLSGTTLTIMTT